MFRAGGSIESRIKGPARFRRNRNKKMELITANQNLERDP